MQILCVFNVCIFKHYCLPRKAVGLSSHLIESTYVESINRARAKCKFKLEVRVFMTKLFFCLIG